MDMNKKLLALAIAGAVATPFAAQAGSLTVANQDITLSGGVAGGYVNNTDAAQSKITATDALVDLSSEAKAGGVGFDVGIGVLAGASLGDSQTSPTGPVITGSGSLNVLNTATTGAGTALQYGWLTIMPTDGLSLQAGTLATNVGYEVVPSYANANIVRGLVWSRQPAYYNGIRATYNTGNMSVYVEGSNDPYNPTNPAGNTVNSNGQAIGASATMGAVNGSISYFNDEDNGSIVDVIASSKMGSMTFAANLDYITKADRLKVAGTDDNAWGIALYASMPMGANASLPVRVEYVADGTSNIYGLATTTGQKNNAYTITITPTYNFSKATFVRAELAYIALDKKTNGYVDDKGIATDGNMTLGLQGGLMF
jgi:hypothetical protein